MERLSIRVLGAFEVRVDGRAVPGESWRARRSADLVKLLALSDEHRLPRDRVVEALWPRLPPKAGLANLHKAAHVARKGLGDRDAVVLRAGHVLLAPAAATASGYTPSPRRTSWGSRRRRRR